MPNITVGNYDAGGGGGSGYQYEIIAYSAALSVADRQKLEGYLAQKWGLVANLPNGHPGKDPLPVVTWNTPAAGNYASGSNFNGANELSVDAIDNGTVTGVVFKQNGTVIPGSPVQAGNTWTMDWMAPADGAYTITAEATDGAAGVGVSGDLNVIVGSVIDIAMTTNAAEPASNGLFTLTRSGDTSLAIDVNISVSGSATSGVDYTALPASVHFNATDTTATLDVLVIDDGVTDMDETVQVNILAGAGYALGSTTVATLTITDDDGDPSLVAWYRFNEAGGATTAVDSSLYGNDVSVGGGIPGSASFGSLGNCYDFTASGYVDAGNPAQYLIQGDMTLMIWVNPDNVSGERGLASKWGSSWCWVTNAGKQRLYFNGWRNANTTIAISTWSHLAVVYSDADNMMYFYYNGVPDGNVAQTGNQGTGQNLTIGQRGGGGSLWDGKMDDIRVYDRALTPAEILSIYDGAFNTAPVVAWNTPPTPADGSNHPNGQSFTLSVDATDAEADPLTVVFKANGVALPAPTKSGDTYDLVWSPADGAYAITAEVTDGTELVVTSFVNILVGPVLTIANTADGNEAGATTSGEFTITRTGDTTQSVDITFTVAGGATPGVDYTALVASPVTIGVGLTTVTIAVDVLVDTLLEGPEMVEVTITGSTIGTLGATTVATVTIIDDDIDPNMVAWYELEETAGTNADDSTAGDGMSVEYDGAVAGVLGWMPLGGRINGGLDLNGISDYVDLSAHVGAFSSLSAGSIAGWFQTSAGTRGAIFSSNETASDDRVTVEVLAGGQLSVKVRNASSNLIDFETTVTVNDGAWHHFAITQDGSTGATLYLDGTEVGGVQHERELGRLVRNRLRPDLHVAGS